MIAKITYFDLKGYKIKIVKVDSEYCSNWTQIIFPGDMISAILKMKSKEKLPEIEGSKYHILIEVTSQETQISKLVPYDYLEEMEKMRNMSSKDIESFTR